MKPQKLIAHRERSELAVCMKQVGDVHTDVGIFPLHCGNQMQLHVTVSPMRGYSYLVVLRCPEHISHAWGVAVEQEEYE